MRPIAVRQRMAEQHDVCMDVFGCADKSGV